MLNPRFFRKAIIRSFAEEVRRDGPFYRALVVETIMVLVVLVIGSSSMNLLLPSRTPDVAGDAAGRVYD